MTSPLGPARAGGNIGGVAIGGTAFAQLDMRHLQQLGRDMAGRIGKAPTQVRVAHRRMALEAGETIARYLEVQIRRTGRTQRPNDTLVQLLRSPNAVDASSDGWVVGRAGFFESSAAAPYYRNLETGTRIHVGRELRGFFMSAQGKASPPSGERYRRDPRLIQVNKFFAGTKESREELKRQQERGDFRPGMQTYGRTKRRLPEPRLDSKGRVGSGGFKIIIRRPIPAYRYFELGGERFMRSGAVARIYNAELTGLPGYIPIK